MKYSLYYSGSGSQIHHNKTPKLIHASSSILKTSVYLTYFCLGCFIGVYDNSCVGTLSSLTDQFINLILLSTEMSKLGKNTYNESEKNKREICLKYGNIKHSCRAKVKGLTNFSMCTVKPYYLQITSYTVWFFLYCLDKIVKFRIITARSNIKPRSHDDCFQHLSIKFLPQGF